MTSTILLRRENARSIERTDVRYAEKAVRSEDNESGVALQYEDGDTEFIVDGEIVGVYPDGMYDPFTEEYKELVV